MLRLGALLNQIYFSFHHARYCKIQIPMQCKFIINLNCVQQFNLLASIQITIHHNHKVYTSALPTYRFRPPAATKYGNVSVTFTFIACRVIIFSVAAAFSNAQHRSAGAID